MGRKTGIPQQRGLFDVGPPEGRPPRGSGVGAAPVGEDLEILARRLPGEIRLGTSSWAFPGWAGIVYDRSAPANVLSRLGLGAYARHPLLRAVGLDRTFYTPIPASAFAAYASQVPEDFRFLVKAPSACTAPRFLDGPSEGATNPFWLDPAWASEAIVAPAVDGLGSRLGPLVFQFPPQGRDVVREAERFAERLASFLERLPRGPSYAVELRDAGLLGARYGQALGAGGATHAVSVHPRMPPLSEQAALVARDAGLVVRWMLHAGQGYDEARRRYAPFDRLVDEDVATRDALASLCLDWAARGRPVTVIANNKAEGSAPLTVFRLAARIAEGRT